MTTGVMFQVDAHDVIHDLTKVEFALSQFGMSKFLSTNLGPWLQHRATERFMDEGDAASGKWLPLTGATQEIRENMGYPRAHPINKRTGELENYVTGSQWAVTPTPTGAMLTYPGGGQRRQGTIRQKVRAAQVGYGKTPPRPVLAVDETDMIFLMTRMRFHFEDPIGMSMSLGRA